MKYDQYKYLFPPRPVNRISTDQIEKYDNGEYVAEVKYDGSACVVFLNEGFVKVMNRHNEPITNPFMDEIDWAGLYSGKGFMIICGELLNKNKLGEHGTPLNKKFVIWDILVYNGDYMVGATHAERLRKLEILFPTQRMQVTTEGMEEYNHLSFTNVKGVFKKAVYTTNFTELFNDLITTQLYEGIIIKRLDAKLQFGFVEKNNFQSTLKCRKSTKNYAF